MKMLSVLILAVLVSVCGCSLAPVAISGIVTFGSEVNNVSICTSAGMCDVVPQESNSFTFSGYARKCGDELVIQYYHPRDGESRKETQKIAPSKATFIEVEMITIGDILNGYSM